MPDGFAPAPPAPPRRKERWWLHGLLLLLTLGTTSWVGANLSANYDPTLVGPGATLSALLLRGCLTFSLPILAILFSHEMGHYLMCRYYGVDASPPYFIPFPSIVGTAGAFIRIREPFRNKRQLFDIGVAGPIAGFVVLLPFLAWGVTHSRPNPATVLTEGTIIFRYPLLVTLFQKLILGTTFTSVDSVEHPVFIAAWFGLLATAMNLIPLSQFDGGHALYAVFGRWQRSIAISILVVLVFLGIHWWVWFVWIAITLFIGIQHPPVLDEELALDPGRKFVAAAVLLIFALCFAPVPLEFL